VYVGDPPPGREMCDFCHASPTSCLYACRNFVPPNAKDKLFQGNVGAWAACDRCAVLIDAGHWLQLTDRAVRKFLVVYSLPRSQEHTVWKYLREIHQVFREHMIKELRNGSS